MTSAEVKQIRLALGLTRAQFANELGASVRTVEAWETRLEPGGIGRACIYALQTRKRSVSPERQKNAPKAAGLAEIGLPAGK